MYEISIYLPFHRKFVTLPESEAHNVCAEDAYEDEEQDGSSQEQLRHEAGLEVPVLKRE